MKGGRMSLSAKTRTCSSGSTINSLFQRTFRPTRCASESCLLPIFVNAPISDSMGLCDVSQNLRYDRGAQRSRLTFLGKRICWNQVLFSGKCSKLPEFFSSNCMDFQKLSKMYWSSFIIQAKLWVQSKMDEMQWMLVNCRRVGMFFVCVGNSANCFTET